MIGVVVAGLAVYGFRAVQSGTIDRKQLRDMLVQLGYDVTDLVKDPGKEKYTVKMSRYDLDIPIGFELSSNNNYIWLTVNLGAAPAETAAKNYALLRQNAKVQPSQFYITEGKRLMLAMPIDNRGVTNATLRKATESVAEDVGSTKAIWQ